MPRTWRTPQLFLEGREDDVIGNLNRKMNHASDARRYEEAAAYRDQVRALSRVQTRQYVESNRGVDADVVACVIDGEIACVNLVMIRDRAACRRPQLLPGERRRRGGGRGGGRLPGAALRRTACARAGGRKRAGGAGNIHVVTPSHGERKIWLDMARKNALLAIAQRVRDRATQEGRLLALREALGLPEGAQRIECFDISHTMGEATVASCVVYDRSRCRNPNTGASTSATSRRATTTPPCSRCWRGATSA